MTNRSLKIEQSTVAQIVNRIYSNIRVIRETHVFLAVTNKTTITRSNWLDSFICFLFGFTTDSKKYKSEINSGVTVLNSSIAKLKSSFISFTLVANDTRITIFNRFQDLFNKVQHPIKTYQDTNNKTPIAKCKEMVGDLIIDIVKLLEALDEYFKDYVVKR